MKALQIPFTRPEAEPISRLSRVTSRKGITTLTASTSPAKSRALYSVALTPTWVRAKLTPMSARIQRKGSGAFQSIRKKRRKLPYFFRNRGF